MTAIKTTAPPPVQGAPAAPQSTVLNPRGNIIQVQHAAPVAGMPTITISQGGQTSINLSQANVTDLLATLTAFSVTGLLT